MDKETEVLTGTVNFPERTNNRPRTPTLFYLTGAHALYASLLMWAFINACIFLTPDEALQNTCLICLSYQLLTQYTFQGLRKSRGRLQSQSGQKQNPMTPNLALPNSFCWISGNPLFLVFHGSVECPMAVILKLDWLPGEANREKQTGEPLVQCTFLSLRASLMALLKRANKPMDPMEWHLKVVRFLFLDSPQAFSNQKEFVLPTSS